MIKQTTPQTTPQTLTESFTNNHTVVELNNNNNNENVTIALSCADKYINITNSPKVEVGSFVSLDYSLFDIIRQYEIQGSFESNDDYMSDLDVEEKPCNHVRGLTWSTHNMSSCCSVYEYCVFFPRVCAGGDNITLTLFYPLYDNMEVDISMSSYLKLRLTMKQVCTASSMARSEHIDIKRLNAIFFKAATDCGSDVEFFESPFELFFNIMRSIIVGLPLLGVSPPVIPRHVMKFLNIYLRNLSYTDHQSLFNLIEQYASFPNESEEDSHICEDFVSFRQTYLAFYYEVVSTKCFTDSYSLYFSNKLLYDIETNPGPFSLTLLAIIRRVDRKIKKHESDLTLVSDITRLMSILDDQEKGIALMLQNVLFQTQISLSDLIGFNTVTSELHEISDTVSAAMGAFPINMRNAAMDTVDYATNKIHEQPIKVGLDGGGFFDTLKAMIENVSTPVNMCVLFAAIVFSAIHYKSMALSAAAGMMVTSVLYCIKDYNIGSLGARLGTLFQFRAEGFGSEVAELIIELLSFVVFGRNLMFDSVSDFSKSFKLFESASVSGTKFMLRVKAWFEKLFSLFGDHFGWQCFSAYGKYTNTIKNLRARIAELHSGYKAHFAQDPSTRKAMDSIYNMNFCRSVHAIDGEIRNALAELINEGPSTEAVRKCFQEMSHSMADLIVVANNAGLNKGRRVEPYVLGFVGDSGVGKTFQLEYISQRLDLVERSKAELEDYKVNPGRHIYTLKAGQQHYDGYMNQSVIMMPDMFTTTDAEGQESEASFIINNVSEQPMPLPCANLSLKEKVFARNRLLTFASNQRHLYPGMFKSIRNPQAVVRRLQGHVWRVYAKEEFATESYHEVLPDKRNLPKSGRLNAATNVVGAGEGMATEYRLDYNKIYSKLGPGLHMDVYEYVQWDVVNDAPLAGGKVFKSIHNFVKFLQNDFHAHLCKSSDMIVSKNDLLKSVIDEEIINLGYSGLMADAVSLGFKVEMDNDSDATSYVTMDVIFDQVDDIRDEKDPFLKEELIDSVDNRIATLGKEQLKTLLDAYTITPVEKDRFEYLVKCRKEKCPPVPSRLEKDFQMRYILDTLNDEQFNLLVSFNHWDKFGVCKHFIKVKDYTYAVFENVLSKFDSVIETLHQRALKPVLWCVEHPYLSCVVLSTTGLAVVFTAYKLFSRWFHTDSVNVDFEVQSSELVTDEHVKSFLNSRVEAYYQIKVVYTKDGVSERRNALNLKFIGDHTAVTVRHLKYFLDAHISCGYKVVLELYGFRNLTTDKANYRIHYDDITWTVTGDNSDRIFLTFPKNLINIQSYLIDEYPSIKTEAAFFDWLMTDQYKEAVAIRRYTNGFQLVPTKVRAYKTELNYYVSCSKVPTFPPVMMQNGKLGLLTTLDTTGGDCGMEIYITDAGARKFGKRFSNPVPVYTHVGREINTLGSGLLTYREMCDPVLPLIKSRSVHTIKEVLEIHKDNVLTFSEALAAKVKVYEVQHTEFVDSTIGYEDKYTEEPQLVHPAIAKEISPITTIPYDKMAPKTQIKKSKYYYQLKDLYGKLDIPVTKRPAINYKRVVDGVELDPMVIALKDYSTGAQLLSAPRVQCVINKCVSDITAKSRNPKEFRREPLTFEEVFQGEEGVRKKMKDSSAPGFTFGLIKKMANMGKSKGRRFLWENCKMSEQYLHDSEIMGALKAVVMKLDARLKSGQRVCNINEVNLKDELRPFEKVKEGKSRTFFCQELPFLVLSTMYFWPFVNWITSNKIRNGMLIGVNPYGKEWEQIYNLLKELNDKGHFGDYAGYDKKLFLTWQYAVKGLYTFFYGPTNPIIPILDLMMEELIESIHIIPGDNKTGFVAKWRWGNTSGNFMTTVINCVANICMVVYALSVAHVGGTDVLNNMSLREMDFIDDIIKNLRIVVMGDDNAYTLDAKYDGITFPKIQAAMAELGLNYTDDTKGKGVVRDHTPLTEGSIIGRTFHFNDDLSPGIVGALRMHSILESLMWNKTGSSDEQTDIARFQVALGELSLHGRTKFDSIAPGIIEIMSESGLPYPVHAEWYDAFLWMKDQETPYDFS